jgi:putative membrane protein (TIGR04086 family)
MLAALSVGAVLVGVAAGSLAASVVALVSSGILVLLGFEAGPGIGLVLGIVLGLGVGGWVAGKRARHSSRFHGAVTGLVLAFVVMVIAVLGGSPASTITVVWLAFLSAVIAGIAGWLAGRQDSSAT